MKTTFLGTGSSQGVPVIACAVCQSQDPRAQRLRSSLHLTQYGKSLRINAGPDLRCQALRAGIQEVDALLLTH